MDNLEREIPQVEIDLLYEIMTTHEGPTDAHLDSVPLLTRCAWARIGLRDSLYNRNNQGCVQVLNLNPSHSFGEETTRPVTSVWTLSQYSSHHRAAAATGGATQPVIESEVTHLNSFNCSLTQRLNFPDPPLIFTSDCPNRRVTDTHSDADECVLAWLSAPDIVTQTRVPTLSSLPFKLRCQSPQTSSATGATTFNE